MSPRVEVTSTGDSPVLRETTLVECYRIAREAIVNALRHAKASKISVLVSYRKPELRVRVLDDGCGIGGLHGDSSLSGHGMGDMKRRSSDLHGSLSVVSVAGSGTEVEFRINLERTGDLNAGGWRCAKFLRTLVRPRTLTS